MKVSLNTPESIVSNKAILAPLVQSFPTAIRSRLGEAAIVLNASNSAEVFANCGVKIWIVKEDANSSNYFVKFQLSASVVDGVPIANPGKGGNFNFSVEGWTSVGPEDGWFNVGEAELRALEGFADWCSAPKANRSEKPPALWWDLKAASELVLVPYLDKDVEVAVKGPDGKKIPTGAVDSKGNTVFKTELRSFIKWSFMFTDSPLSGAGVHAPSITRDQVALIDPNRTLCLI